MKRTPDSISKARQEAGREIKIWRAGIREAQLNPESQVEVEAKIAFGKQQIAECQKRIKDTLDKGKKEFWPHDRHC